MTSTRRQFLGQLTSGGMALVVSIPSFGCRRSAAGGGSSLTPNQWIEIDGEGTVTLVIDKSEMGQGAATALAMIMADELGADWDRVRLGAARPGPRFTEMGTSGSSSVPDAWFGHRVAAAAARTMLIGAAATRWSVSAESCQAQNGVIEHPPSRRRIGFGDLVADASRLPVPSDPPLKTPDQYRIIGTRVADRALPAIVAGTATYGIDLRVPGMRFATIARCPIHGGRLRRFTADRAKAVTGVERVVEVPAGVAVVAASTWAAIKGREALVVEWDATGPATFDNRDGWRRLDRALRRGGKVARTSGNVAAGLARAATRLTAEYRWTWQAHAAIEPLSAIARVDHRGCEVWAGTQNPNGAQARLAEVLGIPVERVIVNVSRLGGAFGRRIGNDYIVEAALVSRAIAGPVQVVWTREDDFHHDRYNPAQLNRLTAGLDREGRPVAWHHQVADFHLSMFGDFDPNQDPAADGNPWGGFDTPYPIPDLSVELALIEAPVPTGAWRAVTYPAAVLARECFLDEIAHRAGVDPVDLRLSLIPSPGTVTRNGRSYPNGDRLRQVVRLAAERAGWGTPLPAGDGRRHGRGFACNGYHQGTMVAQVAEVSVGSAGDLRVHRIVSAVDGGRIVNPLGVEQQFEGGVAWALTALLGPGVRFERGRTVTSSFADYPILRLDQMPVVETHQVASDLRPFGMGEPPVPAVAPAVLNAVFAATGIRHRDLPLPVPLGSPR